MSVQRVPRKWERPAAVASGLIAYQLWFRPSPGPVMPAECLDIYSYYERCAKRNGHSHSKCDVHKDVLVNCCGAVDDGNSMIVDVEKLKKAKKQNNKRA